MEQKTTSPVSAPCCLRNKRGFTLLELLVVMLIIALLAGLLIPVVMRSQRQAKRIKTASDLQAIGVALAAYKADFADYPRVDIPGTGFAVLCKALISPGPAGGPLPALGAAPYAPGTYTSTGTPGQPGYTEFVAFGKPDATGGFTTSSPQSDATTWAVFGVSDGLDRPGFRVRFGGQPKIAYLQPEKFNVRGMAMFDVWGHPILYFPGRPQKPVADPVTKKLPLLGLPGSGSLYTYSDNVTFFNRFGETTAANALIRMDAFIVDKSTNFDGIVDPGETAITTGDYLLWSAGQDGSFGVTFAGANPTSTEVESCDDVTNFSK